MELLVVVWLLACLAAGFGALAVYKTRGKTSGFYPVLALLAVPIALLLLGVIGSLIERVFGLPHVPPEPCERGCSPGNFTREHIDRTSVWRCPCGLSYVMRAPSFGVHEMRQWNGGDERPYLRRRWWWRWRVVEARPPGPYR